MTSPKSLRIAIIIASIREPRVAPDVVKYVTDAVSGTLTDSEHSITLTTIDLLDWTSLPSAPIGTLLPAHQPADNPSYSHAVVDKWSREIRAYDAYIFVTPQYNWSIPAPLKVGLDNLFHEWSRKPAMIVSYGSHGGDKAAAQLRQVLRGMRMLVQWEGVVMLPLGKGLESAIKGKLEEAVVDVWNETGKKEELVEGLKEMVEVLGRSPEELMKGEKEARERELAKREALKGSS
ncbi:hypothetical protein BP6252_03530 [Coleophoma cylindrospora]|uniref:NADPH-dependent FMN reductase-like domain-containing protein n=1 Tax=Coleophoma cylindrospora TaxID=1849047 RepID=A0A3D8S9E1_9HELO|nr:hypothetical protein BP6252_03530 [Coleophoma cylindrospora]